MLKTNVFGTKQPAKFNKCYLLFQTIISDSFMSFGYYDAAKNFVKLGLKLYYHPKEVYLLLIVIVRRAQIRYQNLCSSSITGAASTDKFIE